MKSAFNSIALPCDKETSVRLLASCVHVNFVIDTLCRENHGLNWWT